MLKRFVSLRNLVSFHFFLLFIAHYNFGQTLDNTFAPHLTGAGKVTSIVEQPDGKILAGGSFAVSGSTSRRNIIRFNADGTLDATFLPGTGFDNEVRSIVLQPDGKILVTGYFREYNGTAITNGITRLLSNGSIDPSFNASQSFTDNPAEHVHVLPDGKLLVIGPFIKRGNETRGIVRLNSDGSADDSYTTTISNQSGSSSALARSVFAVLPDGKILLGGEFTHVDGQPAGNLVRLNADGTRDATFQIGEGANGGVNEIVLLPDGKTIIAGLFTSFRGTDCNKVARLNADGTLDNTFTNPFGYTTFIAKILRQADGRYIVLGEFSTPAHSICRLNADGTFDNTFAVGSGFDGKEGYAIKLLADGTLLIGGDFITYKEVSQIAMVCLNSTGAVVGTKPFSLGGRPLINTTLILPDGKILVGGNFLMVDGVYQRNLARLNPDGTRDATFVTGAGPDEPVTALARQADGKILVGGEFTYFNAVASRGLARIDADGAHDATFSGIDQRHFGDGVRAFLVQNDGNIIMAGYFQGKNGTVRRSLIRVSPTGVLDNTFNPDNVVPSESRLSTLLPLADGRLLVGGPNNNSSPFYCAFANGVPDQSFFRVQNTGVNVLRSFNDKIIFGARDGIKLINNDGTPFPGFAPQDNVYVVNAVEVINNKILTANGPSLYSGFPGKTQLRYYDLDGKQDLSMNKIVDGEARHLALDAQGDLLVAGAFSAIDGQPALGLARITILPLPQPPTTLNATLSTPSSIQLSWADNSSTETGFEVQRSVGSNASFVTIGTVPSNTPSYTDNEISSSVTYYYRVLAVNLRGNSAPSNEVSVTSVVNPFPASSPLTANATAHNRVRLEWPNVPGDETGYHLYRSTSQHAGFERITIAIKDATTFTDQFVLPSTQYFYKVRVAYGTSFSSYSDAVSVTTPVNPLQPASNLTLAPVGFNQIKLTWADNSTVETGYKVYRRRDPVSIGTATIYGGVALVFSEVATVPANTTEYLDNDASPGVEYHYYVVAARDSEVSAPTTIMSARANSDRAGAWVQKNNFDGTARRSAVSFVIGTKAYISTGINGSTRLKDLWEYNAQTDDWVQKADFPGTARFGAIGFSIGGKGYVGLGNSVGGGPFDRDLYEYDPVANSWTRKADFPADPVNDGGRTSASVFVLKGLAYVVFGNNGVNNPKTVYAYDPVSNQWIQKADFPGDGRMSGVAFTAGNKAYAGFGTSLNKYKDFYSYDPVSNQWSTQSSIVEPSQRASSSAVSTGIMLAGDISTTFGVETNTKQVYQYVHGMSVWVAWPDFSGAARGSGIAFRIGNKHYFGTGSSGSTHMQDIWEFTPTVAPPPAAPKDLKATYVSATALDVSWTNVGDTYTSIVIERSLNPTSGFVTVKEALGGEVKFTDNGLTASTLYYYRARAVNAEGNSPYVSTSGFTAPKPAAPAAFTLESLSSSAIKLVWSEDLQAATFFNIYRSTTLNGSYTKIFTTPVRQLTYTDNSANSDTEYFYYVEAGNPNGTSDPSEKKGIVSLAETPVLSQGSVTATSVVVNWTGTFKTGTQVELYQSLNNLDFVMVGPASSANAKTRNITGLATDVTYYYKIRSKNTAGYSPFSNILTVTTRPAVPQGVTVTSNGSASVTVNWTKSANTATYYRAYLKNASSTVFTDSVTTAADASSATFFGLMPDMQFKVAVSSINTSGKSARSTEVSVFTRSQAPQQLAVTGDNMGNHLTWLDPSVTETAVVIERSENTDANFQILKQLPSNATSYTDNLITKGRTYYYRVHVVNPGGASLPSNVVEIASDLFVSIETSSISGLQVYPNPVRDRLHVRVGDQTRVPYQLGLYDMQGRLLFSSAMKEGELQGEVPMEQLSAGLYMLQITTPGKREVRIISKE